MKPNIIKTFNTHYVIDVSGTTQESVCTHGGSSTQSVPLPVMAATPRGLFGLVLLRHILIIGDVI